MGETASVVVEVDPLGALKGIRGDKTGRDSRSDFRQFRRAGELLGIGYFTARTGSVRR
jgi:hypothetical protein